MVQAYNEMIATLAEDEAAEEMFMPAMALTREALNGIDTCMARLGDPRVQMRKENSQKRWLDS